MTNIKQKISEVEKGCGKGKCGKNKRYREFYNHNKFGRVSGTFVERYLCPTCQATLQTLKSCEKEIESLYNDSLGTLRIDNDNLKKEITKLQEEEKAKVEKLKEELYKGDKTLRDSAIKISFNQIEIIIDKIFSQEETGEKLI